MHPIEPGLRGILGTQGALSREHRRALAARLLGEGNIATVVDALVNARTVWWKGADESAWNALRTLDLAKVFDLIGTIRCARLKRAVERCERQAR